MIPEEDRGPAWLRDYGSGGIEADIKRMDEFAAKLEAEVRDNYIPHMRRLQQEMVSQLPPTPPGFPELEGFLKAHHGVQQDTSYLVHTLGNASGGFALAAGEVSANYSKSDAFSAARSEVVAAALERNRAAAPPKPGAETTTPAPNTTDSSGVS